MPKIISLQRWHPRAYSFYGEEITLEVKALTRAEGPAFVKQMASLGERWAAAMKAGSDSESEVLELLESEDFASAFHRFVRIAPGQEITWEGEAATADILYREGSAFFLMEVLTEIQRLAVLSVSEGKASGLRSGSSSAASAPGNSASDAQHIASGNGSGPSIATEQSAPAPSSAESTTA